LLASVSRNDERLPARCSTFYLRDGVKSCCERDESLILLYFVRGEEKAGALRAIICTKLMTKNESVDFAQP
jgi:hypothetical protein